MLAPTLLIRISSEGQALTDDALYAKAYNEAQNRNWPIAGAYLFAYIQRNPVDFLKDKSYEKQVTDAFNSSIANIETEKKLLRDKINRQDDYIRNLEARLKIPASSSQGLSTQPPIPSLKQPAGRHAQAMTTAIVRQRPLQGQWRAILTSSSGTVFTGTLLIVTNEDVVSGTFTLSGKSDNTVAGLYDGENLLLLRNTGAITIQTYTLKKVDENHFSGLYKNEGRVPDDGRVELSR